MSGHTPGPWVFAVRPNHRLTGSAHYTVENPTFDGPCPCGARHPPGKLIAWLAGGLGDAALRPEQWRHDESTEADARLIAAAPDLLDAAKLTALHFKRSRASGNFQGDDEHEAWTALDKAITKAEGR